MPLQQVRARPYCVWKAIIMRFSVKEAAYAAVFLLCTLPALSSAQQHRSALTSRKKLHTSNVADLLPMGLTATCSQDFFEGCSASVNMIEFTNGDERHQYPYAGAMISIVLLISMIVAIGYCSSSVS